MMHVFIGYWTPSPSPHTVLPGSLVQLSDGYELIDVQVVGEVDGTFEGLILNELHNDQEYGKCDLVNFAMEHVHKHVTTQ